MKHKLDGLIAARRRAAPARLLARLAERYLRAWYNQGRWDMATNGESAVLRTILGNETSPLVMDVGANRGEWSEAVLGVCPTAQIHAFEIAPDTFGHLE